jgi:16S rRNA (cytidine1402-2'-O)-methyltransferase
VADGLLGFLRDGLTVAVCSDGGCPGISDPGYRIISKAVEAGLEMTVVPGASAVHTALLLSGLPTSSYTFLGYAPRKDGARGRMFEAEREREHTLVLFESPHRVGKTLAAALGVLGDRKAAVCLEMTKKYERVERGFLSELGGKFEAGTVRGEVTIVIAGNHPKFAREDENESEAGGDGNDSSDGLSRY